MKERFIKLFIVNPFFVFVLKMCVASELVVGLFESGLPSCKQNSFIS